MASNANRKVLVCPLEWGLGHASRCVPVIYELKRKNYLVTVGASPYIRNYLSTLIPGLEFANFPSLSVQYPFKNAFLSILLFSPRFVFFIFYEHIILKRFLQRNRFSLIISDNRYGIWNKNVKSVFISHQIFPQLPFQNRFIEKVVRYLNHKLISKFDECWIPDLPGNEESFSGELSHGKIPSACRYIGILSRFNSYRKNTPVGLVNRILVILSGPEPQRTILENIILKEADGLEIPVWIIRGKPEKSIKEQRKNITILSHTNDDEFFKLITESEYIICRSGYSTVMDIAAAGRTALLIPTPGQTEQEYIARFLAEKGRFFTLHQKDFSLAESVSLLKKNTLIRFPEVKTFLEDIIPYRNIKGE